MSDSRTITVSGTGRVTVRPDVADLRLGVTVTAKAAKAARQSSATVMNAVIEALKAIGVGERDLRTSIVSVAPAYDYSGSASPPRPTGYAFTNLVAAIIRDVEKVADAIDAALTAGATNIDHLAFRLADPLPAERQARDAAVADARAKAETLAAAAGVSLAGVAAIVDGEAPVPYPMPHAELAAFRAGEASTPIESGIHEISATVTVVFLIET